jgi:hypothetical protein
MSAHETLGQSNGCTQQTKDTVLSPLDSKAPRATLSRRGRIVALLVGSVSLASVVGCGTEGDALEADAPEVAESEQALKIATDAPAASASARQVATAPRASAVKVAALPSGGVTVFGQGTIVVAFTRDPDGAWHCIGDADCNKMFSAGVCGGILDSSCDTTGTVQCWCY